MRDVVFTLYRNKWDNRGHPVKQPWEKWIEILTDHKQSGIPADSDNPEKLKVAKENGPAIILGEIPTGQYRKDKNIVSIHGVSLDLDEHPQEVVLNALARLNEFEFVAYTSYKHGSAIAGAHPRLRAILPLKTPVKPSDHKRAWHGLNALVGGINDPNTKNIGRMNFLPATFDISLVETHHNTGRWIELDDFPEIPTAIRQHTPEAEQALRLEKVRNRLKAMLKNDCLKEAASSLLKGEMFAFEGERHQTILDLTMRIASKEDGLNHETISSLFEPSLSVMSIYPDPPTLDDVCRAYDGAVVKIQEHLAQEQLRFSPDTKPYTDEDLKRIAAFHGWEPQELQDRWVIQSIGGGWVLSESGEYCGPYPKDDMGLAIKKNLARSPIRLITTTSAGTRNRSKDEIVGECGSLADRILSDLTLQRTTYDPKTRTVHEAICPVRKDIEPKFDPDIDAWLKALAGPLYSKLIDWMSCCSDLTKLMCAIYFHGPSDAGKTLFVYGLSKIWTDGPPADIAEVLKDFNEELLRCPLILADEEIPKNYHQTVTATLRSMLSTTARTLKRKWRAPSELRGAVRLILTANNEFLLNSQDVSSAQDLVAIAKRFLYIRITDAPATFLEGIPRKTIGNWLNRGIAAHTLWLVQNHEIKEIGKRFWVEGDLSQMHRMLLTGTHWNSLVCEWLVGYLMEPNPFDTLNTGLIRREGGLLFVNNKALSKGWGFYLPKIRQEPVTRKIGMALSAISSDERIQKTFRKIRYWYRRVDIPQLFSWSDQYGIGDQAYMINTLNIDETGDENKEEREAEVVPMKNRFDY